MRRVNIYSALLLMAFCGAMLLWAIPANTAAGDGYGVSPATLPNVLVVFILALSVLLLVQNVRLPAGRLSACPLAREGWHNLGRFTLILLVSLALLHLLGLRVGGILIILMNLLYMRGKSKIAIACTSVGVPMSIYVILWYALQVPLP